MLRLTRVAIGRPLTATITRAHILHNVPELLEKFKISNAWVTNFLHHELNWSPWKGTQTAHKVPLDAPLKILKTFCHVAAVVRTEKIPAELMVNPDQTGVCLVPVSNMTFEEWGSSQVDLVGVSEKRQVWLFKFSRTIPSPTNSFRQPLSSHPQQQGTCSQSNQFGGVQPTRVSPHEQRRDGKRLMTSASNMHMVTNVIGVYGKQQKRCAMQPLTKNFIS